jgi:cell division protein ZapE
MDASARKGPQARWEADVAAGFRRDPAQARAVKELETVFHALVNDEPGFLAGLRRKWFGPSRQKKPVRGLYLWGGVGRGKTHLMDLFHQALPFPEKSRLHFHRFMRQAHAGLKRHGNRQDPLEAVADDVARETRVLCFDEFFVSDVADAMILGTLLDALFRRGITLVATSNIPPDDLYRGGLQRQRFMPAIDAIKRHTLVMNMDGGTDYRLEVLERASVYHHPLDGDSAATMASTFRELAPDADGTAESIEILGRDIPVRGDGDGVVWFDFDALCDGPRSQNDYIDLAHEYHTVLLSDVPVMTRENENAARRFIAMVDEFYDRNVKLIISAAAGLDGLYAGERLRFEFQRTRSRLQEMQSRDYLALPHSP